MTGEKEERWEEVRRRRKGGQPGGKRKELPGWRLGTTFLFRNFPDRCSKEDLWERFEEVGKVEDMFLPKKIDKMGYRFGFVRLSKGGSTEAMLKNLNRIWIGSYIIRAFLPKHEREGGGRQAIKEVTSPDRGDGAIVRRPAERVAGLKFVDLFVGRKGRKEDAGGQGEGGELKFVFQSDAADKEWLNGAFVGSLKENFTWAERGGEMQSECAGNLCISYLGNNVILIQGVGDLCTEESLKGYEDWSTYWLDWWHPWKIEDVIVKREVWTKWTGVPLQAWSNAFFEKMCSAWGVVLEIAEITKNKRRLDAAFIKVRTGMDSCARTVECEIDGVAGKIRIDESCHVECSGLKHGRLEVSISESECSFDPYEALHDDESVEAEWAKSEVGAYAGAGTMTGGEKHEVRWREDEGLEYKGSVAMPEGGGDSSEKAEMIGVGEGSQDDSAALSFSETVPDQEGVEEGIKVGGSDKFEGDPVADVGLACEDGPEAQVQAQFLTNQSDGLSSYQNEGPGLEELEE